MIEPAERATAQNHHAVARFAGSITLLRIAILGLAPQASCCRPLRGLERGSYNNFINFFKHRARVGPMLPSGVPRAAAISEYGGGSGW